MGLHCSGLAPGGDPRTSAEAGRILGSRSPGTRPPPARMRGGAGGAGDPGHPGPQCLGSSPRPPSPPLLSLPRASPGLEGARGGARTWWGQCAHLRPRRAPELQAPRRRAPARVEGEAAVLPGGRGGQQRGRRQVREPPRGGRGKAGFGSVPRLETTPAPQPNPRERPGRRRVWRRKRPETVRFHAALGLGFLSRVDE